MSQIGSVQTLVVCVPAQVEQSPCPTGMALAVAQGYIIEPALATRVDAQNQPFDYSAAAGIWSMGFTFVVGLYLVSKSAGIVLHRIKS
ncbi:hypothetical protein RCH14_001639 [Massilia sp. MP_M2]